MTYTAVDPAGNAHTRTAVEKWELMTVTTKAGRNKLALRAPDRHICDISVFDEVDRRRARLIAAAPDLLEAAQRITAAHKQEAAASNFKTCACAVCRELRAAIAAATGEE